MTYLGTGKCEVWVLFHQTDRTGPAPGTLPDSLSIRPKPGYKDTIDWSLIHVLQSCGMGVLKQQDLLICTKYWSKVDKYGKRYQIILNQRHIRLQIGWKKYVIVNTVRLFSLKWTKYSIDYNWKFAPWQVILPESMWAWPIAYTTCWLSPFFCWKNLSANWWALIKWRKTLECSLVHNQVIIIILE